MYAVGKLGGFISRGVVTVSAPFHPFGGAVDIVVVEQQDGSLKSSPWYVQFGKFQGVLKARERVVSLNVNGVDADFRMFLDSKGGAYFVREVDVEDGISESGSWGSNKIVSCSYDVQKSELVPEFEAGNGKVVSQSSSNGPRILGFVFGRRSQKENASPQQEKVIERDREASMERAEIAADLLEVRWSTSLATRKQKKESPSCISNDTGTPHSNGSLDNSPHSDHIDDAGNTVISLSTAPMNFMESFTIEEKYFEVGVVSESSAGSNVGEAGIIQNDEDAFRSESVASNSFVERLEDLTTDAAGALSSGDEHSSASSPCTCSVSGKIDDPVEGLCELKKLTSEVNPEFSGTVLSCEMDKNTENLEDEDPSILVNGSNSGAVTPDDVETVLQTKVEVILDCKTNGGPVKLVDELVVDQVALNQMPSLTNSFLIEEATSAALHLMENLRSEELCPYPPTDSLATSGDVSEDSEGEQFISSDLESSGPLSVGNTSSNFTRNECNSHDCGARDDKLCLSYPDNSKEELDGSTEMLHKSHSFTGELIQDTLSNDQSSCPEISRTTSSPISIVGACEQVDWIADTVRSSPRSWSHRVEMKSQDVNLTICRSLDSSLDSMMLVPADIPAISDNGTYKQHSTPTKSSLEQFKISEELKELLSDPAVEISLCRHLLHEGMGYEAAARAFNSEEVDVEKLVSLGPDFLKNDKVVVRIGGLYFPWVAALPIISAIGSPSGEEILEPKGMINVQEVENAVETNPQHSIASSNGSRRFWPFKKRKSMNKRNSVAEDVSGSQRIPSGNRNTSVSETIKKKFVQAKTPTSEQLASLNLKEGRNTLTFTFSTSMLGEQKVDAQIYLWKWNDRIVISDVDGTITKSDVLGQFMPMVGYDWSQTGVTHLFSAIKENGYKLLFLSARAISQASVTRQFLLNLMQDGKALPEGPVVISPDGLFPSLFREVIRRAPHEFKIACLEDIKALFPPDSNPFYAGFGNRDTDEVSYVKVGIPKSKVFIINPKGEVAVNRRVATKSYTSLHELVHEMFPDPSAVPLSEKEDFNSWNFWKLPPPDMRS